MATKPTNVVRRNLPWSEDVTWYVMAIEAAVLLIAGAYVLIDTDGARDVALQLIGLVFLAPSVVLGLGSLRNSEGLGSIDAFRAGIGVTCGMIATVAWWSDYIEDRATRHILGWCLIAYSMLHVVGLTLVLGVLVPTGNDTTSAERLRLLRTVMLVFAVLLGIVAHLRHTRDANGA